MRLIPESDIVCETAQGVEGVLPELNVEGLDYAQRRALQIVLQPALRIILRTSQPFMNIRPRMAVADGPYTPLVLVSDQFAPFEALDELDGTG